MNRSDLDEAVIAACGWVEESPVVIFGSQSILGSYDEDSLHGYQQWCAQAADVAVAVAIVPGELARHLR